MKKQLFHLTLLFLFGLNQFDLYAQLLGQKTVLWEISGKGLAHPSYLFGTMHIIPKSDFVVYREVEGKLRASSRLIMEMDMNIPVSAKIEMAKSMMLPDKNTLQIYMEADAYNKLKTYVLDSIGVKEARFNIYEKMKPFAFASALIPDIIGSKTESYEMYFARVAKKKKIPVYGLETFEYQLGIFDTISIEQQIDMFLDFSVNPRNEFTQLVEMYKSQDIYQMAASLKKDEKYRHFENKLLTVRNHDWACKLATIIYEKPSFIAVGAAHLAGEHGLIKLMEEKGFTMKPIMLDTD